MTFWVEFQFLGGFGVGIAFWDARPMEMMIIVPFYSALGGFGIMLKTFVFHWFNQVWRRVLRPRNAHIDGLQQNYVFPVLSGCRVAHFRAKHNISRDFV